MKKSASLLIALALAWLLGAVPAWAATAKQALGAYHWGPDYQIDTSVSSLIDGARQTQALGSQIISVAFTPGYNGGDYLPSSAWGSPINSLTDLAKSPPFVQLFNMPFKTYILTAYTFTNYGWTNGAHPRGALTAAQAANEKTEIHDLAKYLLQTYQGTGKSFILMNWEGDWWMNEDAGYNRFSNPTAVQIQANIDFYNARHGGLQQARSEVSVSNVQVQDAIEINLIDKIRLGYQGLLNAVVPFAASDLLAYSSYESEVGTGVSLRQTILTDVAFIQNYPGVNGRPLFIGEFGFNENVNPNAGADTQTAAQAFIDAGVVYANYWAIEDAVGTRGMALARPNGSHSPQWNSLNTMITSSNHAPVAQGQSYTTPFNTAKAVPLTATDADGDLLVYSLTTQPSHGSFSGTAPNLTYTPETGYAGPDSFSFKTNDGLTDSNQAMISLSVVLPAPGSVNSLPASSSKIQLSWSAPAGPVSGYRIYRNGSTVGTTTQTFFTDTGLTAANAYTYWVTAYDATNVESPPSSALTETTLANTAPIFAPSPTLPYNNIRSVTWYDFPTLENQSLGDLQTSLPLIKQTGFNTVWLGGNSWVDYEPTALPAPVYKSEAFTNLRGILDFLRANNMKAILPLNYIYKPNGPQPQGIDACRWTADLAMYKSFEAYTQRFLTELAGYEDMVYIVLTTENSEPCGWESNPAPPELSPLLQATLGSLPLRLPAALRSKFRIGYHDYSIINMGFGGGTSPIQSPMSFDFLSMVGYGLDAMTQSAITAELDWRRSHFQNLYPGVPLIMGEMGSNECAPNSDLNQARVDSTLVAYAINKPMGFNLWQWKSLPPGSIAGQECFAGNPGLGINQNDGVTPRTAVAPIRSLLDPPNQAPFVSACTPSANPCPAQTVTLPTRATLTGSASDSDHLPYGTLSTTWSVISPAGAGVIFSSTYSATTTAQFPSAGSYILRLTADDGAAQATSDVTVNVQMPPLPGGLQAGKTLMFSIDQVFGNGMVPNGDVVALQRIIKTLKDFQAAYKVYAILNPMVGDKTKLDLFLDTLSQNNIPFVLDVYTSDAITLIGSRASYSSPFDASHGLAISLAQVQSYKQKYGAAFSGVRFMEIYAGDFTVRACKNLGANWCTGWESYLPSDSFYQRSIAEPFVQFASQNNMFIFLEDYHWSKAIETLPPPLSYSDAVQNGFETELKQMMSTYPGTILPAFANNEPNSLSAPRLNNWQNIINGFTTSGAAGYALSDQSWMGSPETAFDINTFASWATTAFQNGALAVEFEPVWYLWELPPAANPYPLVDYTQDPNWGSKRGYPRVAYLPPLANALGVTLSNQPPTVSAGPDRTITLPAQALLAGTTNDDGLPFGFVHTTWSVINAPSGGSVIFGSTYTAGTTAIFSLPGTYGLRLDATDGALPVWSSMTVTVQPNSQGSTYQNGNLLYWDNGIVRVGLNLLWGGSIVEFSVNGVNFVNAHDPGREIQPALYDGSATYDACSGCTGVFGWNPVLAGDEHGHGSPVLDYSLTNGMLYTKTRPLQWNPDDKGGSATQAVPSDVYIEQWISAVPNHPSAVKVRNRVTHFGTDLHTNALQELPELSLTAEQNRFVTYQGAAPWTSGAVTVTGSLPPVGGPPGTYRSSEFWSALVNDQNIGVTVYDPASYGFAYGSSYAGPGGPTGDGITYMRQVSAATLQANSVLDAEFYLLGGDYTQARQTVYSLHQTLSSSDPYSPVGWLDVPAAGATVSGMTNAGGWAYDNRSMDHVEVWMDGSLAGTAIYGGARPDVAQNGYPGAPTNIGFNYALDTTGYTNGPHAVQIKAYDASGNTAILPARTVIINNINQPPTVSAGPDRNVTLPTQALLAGTTNDDGLPFGFVHTTWSVINAPAGGSVIFSSTYTAGSSAKFSLPGTYGLRLDATDGAIPVWSSMTVVANPPPLVIGTLTASPNPITGIQSTLSAPVSGGVPPYGFTWTQPANTNLTTTVQNPVVTFSRAGTYSFTLTVTDSINQTATQTLSNVRVVQTTTTVTVNNPGAVSVGQTIALSAVAKDQFTQTIAPSAFAWFTDTGASIDASGNFKATTSGNHVVTATVGPISGTLTINVGAGTTGGTLLDPDLSAIDGKTFSPRDTIVLNYLDNATRFNWEFTFLGASAPAAAAARVAGASNVFPASTPAPQLSLSSLSLPPGRYGLRIQATNGTASSNWSPATLFITSADLSSARVFPNPWRAARGDGSITFDLMPAGSTVKIFTVSGRLVQTLSAPAGIVSWDLKNDSGENIASGLYVFLITDGQGNKTRGKLAVIR